LSGENATKYAISIHAKSKDIDNLDMLRRTADKITAASIQSASSVCLTLAKMLKVHSVEQQE